MAIFSALPCFGQRTIQEVHTIRPNLFVERLQKESGFPLNKVLRIFKDSYGKIWFTGTTGLINYDGFEYTRYTSDQSAKNGLKSGWVESITQDDYGRIWIGTGSGLFYLNHQTNQFVHVEHAIPDDVKVIKEEVTSLYFDKPTHTLFYASHYGLHSYNLSTGLKKFLNFYGNRDDYHKIVSIGRGPDQKLYFTALYDGFYRLNPETMEATVIHFSNQAVELFGINFLGFKTDANGTMWINTWGDGMFRVDDLSENHAKVSIYKWYYGSGDRYMHNIINQFTFFRNFKGEEFMAMASEDNGLMILDPKKGKMEAFERNPGESHTLPDKTCTSILFDQNTLWVGTFNGAAKISLYKQQFNKIDLGFDESKIFKKNHKIVVSDILKDPEEIESYWFTTTEGGLGNLRFQEKKLICYYQANLLKEPNSMIMQTIVPIQDNLFLIGHDRGLILFDKKTGQFKPFPDPLKKTHGSVTSIEYFKEDTLILTIFGRGVKLLDKNTFGVRDFLSDKIQEQRIRYSYQVEPGKVILSTMSDGLYVYHSGKDKVEHFRKTEKGKYFFPYTGLYNFTSDATGAIWCASADGLARQDPQTLQFTDYKTKDGFPDDWVLKTEKGKDEQIWILTRNGLGKINPISHNWQIFQYNQGFDDLQLLDMNQSEDGKIWISAYNKLYFFEPASFRSPDQKPEVYLRSLLINNKTATLDPNQKLNFNSEDQLIEFKFSTIYFNDPEMVKFQVTLIGNQDTLRYNQRKLLLSFLPPGDYTIQVKAFHKNGYWSSPVFQLKFEMLRPWYLTSLFLAVVLFSVLMIFWLLFKFRLKQLKKKAKIQMENNYKLNAMEMKVLRAQINPHFIFNSLNSIQKYVLSNDVLKASDYLGKFSRLIRAVLENSIENNSTLDQENSLLKNYLDLERMRTNFKFDYQIIMDPSLNMDTLIPSMLAQPYLENAIWHGIGLKEENGNIKIVFEQSPEGVKCIIEDDGVGRTKAAEMKSVSDHRSRGLSITEQRLKIAFPKKENLITTEDILNHDGSVGGTRVIILIPTNED